MNKEKLNKILDNHKLWLRTNGEQGEKADLRGADLREADLDYSSLPLACKGLDIHIDDRLAIQHLYHLVRNVQYSKNTSAEMKKLCMLEAIVKKANEFHRVDECGEIICEKGSKSTGLERKGDNDV